MLQRRSMGGWQSGYGLLYTYVYERERNSQVQKVMLIEYSGICFRRVGRRPFA